MSVSERKERIAWECLTTCCREREIVLCWKRERGKVSEWARAFARKTLRERESARHWDRTRELSTWNERPLSVSSLSRVRVCSLSRSPSSQKQQLLDPKDSEASSCVNFERSVKFDSFFYFDDDEVTFESVSGFRFAGRMCERGSSRCQQRPSTKTLYVFTFWRRFRSNITTYLNLTNNFCLSKLFSTKRMFRQRICRHRHDSLWCELLTLY